MIDLGNESPKINIDTPAQIRSIQSVNYLEQICGHSHLLHESGTWVQMPNGRKRKGKRTRMHFRLFSSLKRQAGEVQGWHGPWGAELDAPATRKPREWQRDSGWGTQGTAGPNLGGGRVGFPAKLPHQIIIRAKVQNE